MGSLFCCCSNDSNGYEPVSGNGPNDFVHNSISMKAQRDLENQIDKNADVFTGIPVQQKFSNRSLYENRFVWVKLKTRTIHLSEHMTRERRHKEARLQEVISIYAGPPKKPLSKSDADGDLCLTVHFRHGGGIDLKFQTREQRDRWHHYLKKIVEKNPEQ